MMGIMVAANTAGHATGVPVANLMWNLTGSYRSILVVFAALMVFVLVAFQLVLTQSGKVRKEKMGQV
jgi:predicted MFS family arabinose efflux permease